MRRWRDGALLIILGRAPADDDGVPGWHSARNARAWAIRSGPGPASRSSRFTQLRQTFPRKRGCFSARPAATGERSGMLCAQARFVRQM